MKETKITKEEQEVLDNMRKLKNAREECAKEITTLLEKYNCNIVVDPNSLVKSPQILITNM